LGVIFAGRKEFDKACVEFNLGLQYGFDPVQAHVNLGKACSAQGRMDEAVRHYREALRLWPNALDALNNLAWTLATHRQPEYRNGTEAVQLAERASELTHHRDAGTLDTLAVAYAETGRLTEAIQVARRALALTEASNQKELAAEIQKRLSLYESGKPYRE
jgi:tetratricopeptide (TPR) repeat protein